MLRVQSFITSCVSWVQLLRTKLQFLFIASDSFALENRSKYFEEEIYTEELVEYLLKINMNHRVIVSEIQEFKNKSFTI